jgi:hypothetical protein
MTPDWAVRATAVPYAKFGDPQTLNLYSYVENAPVNRADADGHYAGFEYQLSGTGGFDAGSMEFTEDSDVGSGVQTTVAQLTAQLNQNTQLQAQNQSATNKPAPQPAPTDPNGKPTPPPVKVPGAPDLPWKWNPNSQNPRGGTWGPDGWKGPNPPNGSWDPSGHWDINGGKGEPVDHYDPRGNPITPGQAHPGNAPSQFSISPPGAQAAQTAAKVGVWGTVGAAIIYALGVAFGEIN